WPAVMIKITKRGASGFTVNGNAALAGRHGDEASMPIAPEPETATRVLATLRGADAKEVLRQKKIFVAIAVEVADHNAEHGRELGFDRQRSNLEVITAIEQQHRFESRRSHFAHGRQPRGEHVGDRGR